MRGAKQKEMFGISDLRRSEILHLRSICPPRDIGSGYFMGVQNFEFQYFSFRKLNIFWGMKILWIFFGGHHIIRLYLEVISMHFRVLSEGQGTYWRIFLGLLKFQIFNWGA